MAESNANYLNDRISQVRAANNSIISFLLDSGSLVTDPVAMSSLTISHFSSILAPEFLSVLTVSVAWFQNLSEFRCSSSHQELMLTIPTAAEITRVMFKMNPNKAPGPDGLSSGFYKAAWDIIGSEVLGAIGQFFISSFLPSSTNAIILALVPKMPGASMISHYRLVSCCNTLYKVISRILVSKLKHILPSLILPNQTAFVNDRLLIENTILAAELVNGYHKSKGPKRITIKVDIAKAFDTVKWEFIITCLKGLRLPDQYIRWVEACICTPNFTLGYNGTVQGHFKGKRRLRQGDPLSPYLFVIAINCLSLLLNRAAVEGHFDYHYKI